MFKFYFLASMTTLASLLLTSFNVLIPQVDWCATYVDVPRKISEFEVNLSDICVIKLAKHKFHVSTWWPPGVGEGG